MTYTGRLDASGALTLGLKLWITTVSPVPATYNSVPREQVFHMTADLWQRCCDRLAAELPEQQFNTWIRPLPAADVAEQGEAAIVVTVRVSNRFKLDWIRNQYAGRIEATLSELALRPVRLELTLGQREPVVSAAGAWREPAPALNDSAVHLHQGNVAREASAVAPSRTEPVLPRHRLNPALTFDSLVPGRANQMARTAALHVAGAPGVMYNPLFIYGGVGLGKTHLVHAVGNALLADRPDARVLYLHAEQFISDVVKNYQRKTFDELKAKYHNLDLLLIDDVQFFAGKDRTQEEFFNAFEALLAKRAHIIMTSDTYPRSEERRVGKEC